MALPRFRVTERQVLMLLLIASILAYAGAFLLASFRQRGERLEQVSQPRVRWMPPRSGAPASAPQYLLAEYFDPSLMSLPSAHGFSQRMWQRSTAVPAQSFEPPSELALVEPDITGQLSELLPRESLPVSVQATIQKLPAMDETPTGITNEAVTVVTQSTFRIEGDLSGRGLTGRPELPAVAAEAGLRPTRMRVAVASDGRVRYVALERSCGNETVDAQGQESVRRLRFEPVTKADPLALQWGLIKIYWAIRPAS